MRTLLLTLLACGTPAPVEEPEVPDTSTRRSDSVDTYHGVAVPDPYDWLEDPDAPEVRSWIAEQNVATRAWIDAEPSRPALAKRLGELWQTPRQGAPEREGGRVFFEFNDGTRNQPVLQMAETVGGPAVTVLDPNTFSADGTASLQGWAPSPDGRWLQYGVSEGGSDWTRFEVLSLPDGAKSSDVLTSIKFSGAAWLPDGSGFFYARYPETKDPTAANVDQTVWFHTMGTAQSADRQVYATPEHPDWVFDLDVTEDGAWLVMTIAVGTEERTRVHLIDLRADGQPTIRLLDAFDADYRFVGSRGDRLFFRTTHAAPRYRLIAVDARDGGPERWVQVVPEGPDVLEHAALVGDAVVAAHLADARSALSVWSLDGLPLGEVPLPALGSVDDLRAQKSGAETWFAFTGFTQPTAIYRLDVAARTVTPSWEPTIPFDPSEFRTEQVFVDRPDGVRVPMFLVWKGQDRPKDAPTVLYGYGGFNISVTPGYNPRTIAWLEQGGVWASANLRGGGEYGEAWHEAGTRTHKQTVFDDAIACAEWLIAQGVSSPKHLAIHGRSNGGLLAGAVVLQRPDLFGAALPTVGVHDMLEYHRWTIGWAWASDYGTVDDPAEFKALLAYSPVHNAKPGRYPAVMMSTADHDDRVVPAHTFKFGAALQHAQQGEAPILVRVETAAGHGAGKSQQMRIDEAADELAFLTRALR